MNAFETKELPLDPDLKAPDGSDVRVLLKLEGGSMAHFELGAGKTSKAVVHRSVGELWYFISGKGEFWRKSGDSEAVVHVHAGISISIPPGTRFQFRSLGHEPLRAVGVTIPAWPGVNEAVIVEGHWGSVQISEPD